MLTRTRTLTPTPTLILTRYAQVTAIRKSDSEQACESSCTCEPNLRVGPVPDELMNEWLLGSARVSDWLGGASRNPARGSRRPEHKPEHKPEHAPGSWVRARGLGGSWARV